MGNRRTNDTEAMTAAETPAAEIQTAAETPAESDADGLTNAKMDKEARSMKAILDSRPKVRVKIVDRDALESGATPAPHPVGINGYVYRIPWNKPVEVPDRVAEILEKQGLI